MTSATQLDDTLQTWADDLLDAGQNPSRSEIEAKARELGEAAGFATTFDGDGNPVWTKL